VDGTITLAQSFNESLRNGEDVQGMFDEEISVTENMKFLGDIGQLAAKCLRRDVKTRPSSYWSKDDQESYADRSRKSESANNCMDIGTPIWQFKNFQ
jgi:hypothetical protein